MRHLDLFLDIGGFALAVQRTWKEGYENKENKKDKIND